MFKQPDAHNKPLSVSTFVRQVSATLSGHFGQVWVTGEIFRFTQIQRTGYCYFGIKDASAQLSCALFDSKILRTLKITPKVGDKIEVIGRPNIYADRGEFQLIVSQITIGGLGQLYEAYIELKNKLEAQGLFAKEHKKPLPFFPKTIGIVTSLQAAALRDVVSTLSRRAPHTQLIIYPTAVQGFGAANEIIRAIRLAISHNVCDILIICRGGGSIEDLWCFNDEQLAYVINQCPIPTISGVGHETDFTICDFVSDFRAETPTAAAERASRPTLDWQNQLSHLYTALKANMMNLLNNANQNLDYLSSHLPTPIHYINNEQDRLNQLRKSLHQNITHAIRNKQHNMALLLEKLKTQRPAIESSVSLLNTLKERLSRAITTFIDNKKNALYYQQSLLDSLGPDNIVKRGYAILQDKNLNIIRSPQEIPCHEPVNVHLAHGQATITIDSISAKTSSK